MELGKNQAIQKTLTEEQLRAVKGGKTVKAAKTVMAKKVTGPITVMDKS